MTQFRSKVKGRIMHMEIIKYGKFAYIFIYVDNIYTSMSA